jgi:hypothetical protein
MAEPVLHSAIPYTLGVERPEADEADTVTGLNEQIHGIQEKTAKDYGSAARGLHAKGHAILKGRIEVLGGLAAPLAQGLFSAPGSYDLVMRYSTVTGDILPDSISGPRGLAIKVLGVSGDRLPGSEADTTQDFVMVNGPAFVAPTPKAFLGSLAQLAKTTDKVEGIKEAVSATLQVIDTALEAVGIKSPTVQTLGGAPNTHPLGETYYTQVPFRYGQFIAKLSLAPISPNLTALTGDTVETTDRNDALREVIRETMVEQDGVWELRVQLCTDLEKMPIEDATAVWDEDHSPYIMVARVTVPAQVSWENGTSETQENDLAFNPWHGLAAHQPLGGVNRVRKPVYAASAKFRGDFNGCPMHEPRSPGDLPPGP